MGAKGGIQERELGYNAEVSRRIERLRVEYEARSTELARAAEVTPQMLRAYQVGVSRWPVFRVRLIADYFGVDLDELMPRTENPARPKQQRMW